MRSVLLFAVVMTAAGATTGAAVQEANDLRFTIAPDRKPAVYRVGEPIGISAAIAAHRLGYCVLQSGRRRDLAWRESEDEFRVVPVDAAGNTLNSVYDPYFDQADYEPQVYRQSDRLSSTGPLSEAPHQIQFILNEWARITTPGRYRVTARSSRVSRCSRSDRPPALRTIQSNEIEIVVLSRDEERDASELQEIRGILGSPTSEDDFVAIGRVRDAIYGLSFLDTPDSTRELASRLAVHKWPWADDILTALLLETSWRDIAISELGKGLRQSTPLPQSFQYTLGLLLVAREFQGSSLPDAKQKPDDRRRAIEARGARLNFILAELRQESKN